MLLWLHRSVHCAASRWRRQVASLNGQSVAAAELLQQLPELMAAAPKNQITLGFEVPTRRRRDRSLECPSAHTYQG